MITKEYELLYIFAREPWNRYTFTELMAASGNKSRSYIERFIKRFTSNQILGVDKVSHLPVYSLDIFSLKSRIYAGFTLEQNSWNRKNIPFKDLQVLMEKIPYRDFIFLITGSYAKGTQTKNSDIDAVILINDNCDPKKVYAELKLQSELNIPKVHLYVFKHSEFLEMLTNSEANYGKEIVKNFIILTQGQTYLKIIGDAIKHGFNERSIN